MGLIRIADHFFRGHRNMRALIQFTAVLFTCVGVVPGNEDTATIDANQFQRLHALIKPQPGESRWREIAWFTNITQARRQAAAEGKPLVIFTAADGSPLSRT